MKIVHFSDSHLGITLENTARENDFYTNFENISAYILQEKPDIVIHSGDFFHTPKPSNKSISIAIQHLSLWNKANIVTILVSGNHDSPRINTTTHPFEIFECFEHVHCVYTPKVHTFEFENICIVCVPHIHESQIFFDCITQAHTFIQPGKMNLFISHCGIQKIEYETLSDEITGQTITEEMLSSLQAFDYIGLGHYHKPLEWNTIYYPGSIERTSFRQKNDIPRFHILTCTHTITIEKKMLPYRMMKDFGIFSLEGIHTMEEVIEKLEREIPKHEIADAIVRITFDDIHPALFSQFEDRKIKQFFANSFYLEYKKIRKEALIKNTPQLIEHTSIILDNFDPFIERYSLTNNQIVQEPLRKKLKTILEHIISGDYEYDHGHPYPPLPSQNP